MLRARVWIAQVGRIPLLLLGFRHPGERPRPAQRHRPALRRRPGAPDQAGTAGRHRRGARHPRVHRHRGPTRPGRLPHERGPRRLPRRGAHPRVHGRRPPRLRHRADRRPRPARCSPPTPRCRPVSTGSRWRWCSATSATTADGGLLPGVPVERVLAFGAEDRPDEVQHGAHGAAAGAARQRGVAAARAGQPGDVRRAVAGIRRRRGADRVDHQRCARPDLGGAGVAASWAATWPAPPRRCASRTVWQRLQQVDTGHIWWIRCQLRAKLVDDVRRRLRRSWLERGAIEAELGWIATAFDPGCADDRVRPAGADLQAADADAARPGAARGAAARREQAHPADRGRQVPSRRRRRQGADPADRPLRRPARGPAPHRLPARLRHVDGAAAVLGLRRLAQQPAAAAGSLRHLRDEERAQRRAEPVHPGRLVGRVVRRRERLGDSELPRC